MGALCGKAKVMKRVLVGVPSWGVSPPEASEYRVNLAKYHAIWSANGNLLRKIESLDLGPHGPEMLEAVRAEIPRCDYVFDNCVVPDIIVQLARDRMCETAVNNGYDYVAMIDDDMNGPPDLWKRLLERDVDIIAPLMFMRSPEIIDGEEIHHPVIYAMRGEWTGNNWDSKSTVVRSYPRDTLVEVDAVGFGAVLIKTSVLKEMKNGWFFNMHQTGEDVNFCIEAKKYGFRVFCDTTIKLDHLGPRRWINEENYIHTRYAKKMREAMGEWTIEKSRENLVS
jgi:hypothetical protein